MSQNSLNQIPLDPIPKLRNIKRRDIIRSGRCVITVGVDGPEGKLFTVRFRFVKDPDGLQKAMIKLIEAWSTEG